MHQAQFVSAHADGLEAALTLFGEHVDRTGGPDNWWSWHLAFEVEGGRLHFAAPPEDDGRSESERRADEDRVRAKYGREDDWIRAPWLRILSHCELAGIPWMKVKVDEPMAPEEQATHALLGDLPVSEIPTWFLRTALVSLHEHYAEVAIPGDRLADQLKAWRRRKLTTAFESVYEKHYLELGSSDGAPLPYLPQRSPDEWPAHVVGDVGPSFYLLIDMHT
jgi:hypothetical protein